MIDEELTRSAIGLLATATAMLLEDVHLELVTTPCDLDEAAVATTLQRLGADVGTLGAAAEVLARRSK